jgi:hypothetical protein
MRDLDEVIDLGTATDDRPAEARSVEGRVRPNLDVVLEHDHADLRDAADLAGDGLEAEAFGPDHGAGLEAAAGAEQGSVAAEEMTAQAVAMRDVVADLETMVGSEQRPEASMLFRS